MEYKGVWVCVCVWVGGWVCVGVCVERGRGRVCVGRRGGMGGERRQGESGTVIGDPEEQLWSVSVPA